MGWWEIVDMAWPWVAGILIGVLGGATLGYWTASKDLEDEKNKAAHAAWEQGYSAARNPYSWDDKNPYEKESTT